MGEKHVTEQDQHARRHHSVGRGLAHLHGASLDGVAEVARNTGDDEGKEEALDDAHPHKPLVEGMLQAQRQIIGRHHVADKGSGVGAHDAHRRGENHEERHDGHKAENLGQNQVVGRVHAHDVERVNLLGHAHRAKLRGDVAAHLARENQTHDGAGELQEHDLTRGVARGPTGHPRTLDVHLHLDADDGANEKRDEQHNANGVDTQLGHLLDIAFQKHPQTVGPLEGATHQNQIAAKRVEPPQ